MSTGLDLKKLVFSVMHSISNKHVSENNDMVDFQDFCNILTSISNDLFTVELLNELNVLKTVKTTNDNTYLLSCILTCIKKNYNDISDEIKSLYIDHFLSQIKNELTAKKKEFVNYFDYQSLLNDINDNNVLSFDLYKFILTYLNIGVVIVDGREITYIFDLFNQTNEMNIVLYKSPQNCYYIITYCNSVLWKYETPLLQHLIQFSTKIQKQNTITKTENDISQDMTSIINENCETQENHNENHEETHGEICGEQEEYKQEEYEKVYASTLSNNNNKQIKILSKSMMMKMKLEELIKIAKEYGFEVLCGKKKNGDDKFKKKEDLIKEIMEKNKHI